MAKEAWYPTKVSQKGIRGSDQSLLNYFQSSKSRCCLSFTPFGLFVTQLQFLVSVFLKYPSTGDATLIGRLLSLYLRLYHLSHGRPFEW